MKIKISLALLFSLCGISLFGSEPKKTAVEIFYGNKQREVSQLTGTKTSEQKAAEEKAELIRENLQLKEKNRDLENQLEHVHFQLRMAKLDTIIEQVQQGQRNDGEKD